MADETKWQPEPGRLVTRTFHCVDGSVEVVLWVYGPKETALAQLRTWRTEPLFGLVDTVQGQWCTLSNGTISRHYTTDRELVMLQKLWNDSYDPRDWLEDAIRTEGLHHEEQERLQRIWQS